MKKRLTVFVAAVVGLLALTPIIIGADQPKVLENTPTLEKLDIDMSDLLSVTFLDIYKYRLDLQPGKRFHVVLREQLAADSTPKVLFDEVFHRDDSKDLTLLVSFTSLDDRLSGVLLSPDKQAEFRITSDGTIEPGLATIVPVPLAGVARTDLVLVAQHSNHPKWELEDGAIQLLTIFPSKPANLSAADRGFPRAELVVIPD